MFFDLITEVVLFDFIIELDSTGVIKDIFDLRHCGGFNQGLEMYRMERWLIKTTIVLDPRVDYFVEDEERLALLTDAKPDSSYSQHLPIAGEYKLAGILKNNLKVPIILFNADHLKAYMVCCHYAALPF